jgi:hypothetical protein
MLNNSQRNKIARLEAVIAEAQAITAAIQLMSLERWFPEELRKAVIRFNRKVGKMRKGGKP